MLVICAPFWWQNKSPRLSQETEGQKTLRGTTLVAASFRKTAPYSPPVRAGGITPAARPRLLASSFSRRLQGDIHRSVPTASHRTGGSLRGNARATRPYPRQSLRLSTMISRFSRLSTGKMSELAMFPPDRQGGFLLIAVALGGVAVNTALKQLPAVKLQQLASRNLVKGDHPPFCIHPNPPALSRFFLFLCHAAASVKQVFSPFYAIFV